jgi:hypothetical protein
LKTRERRALSETRPRRVSETWADGLMAVAIGAAAEMSAREHRVVEMSELGF